MAATKQELQIGVIGLGLRGSLSRKAHQPENGVRVTHACDINPDHRKKAVEWFGEDVRFSTEFDELLNDEKIDAVMVLSPDYLHEQQAVALLEAGRAVFLEKPMAITIAGCDRIIAAAEKSGTLLYVGHNMRHMSFINKMKDLIDSGAIGQVQTAWQRHFINYGGDAYYKDWHADRTLSTGLLLQKAAHDLDVMHWLCGGHTTRVHAMGKLSVYNRITDRRDPSVPGNVEWEDTNWPPLKQKGLNPVVDVEDVSVLNAQLDNGVLLSYQQCHYTPDSFRNYTFIGDAGRIESTRDTEDRWVIRVWDQRSENNPLGDHQHVIEKESGGHGGADPKMINQFLACLRSGEPPRCHPVDARMAVAAGYQATISLRHGGIPLEVPAVGEPVEARPGITCPA